MIPESDLIAAHAPLLPMWLKLGYTLFVLFIIPVYFRQYGPGNFLWFSDIALIGTMAALWLESSLLTSALLVGILIPELIWSIGFIAGITAGRPLLGLADYMFDARIPRFLRALSLFHLFLPPLLLCLVYRLGYNDNALILQCLLAWIVLPLSYLLTRPEENINWVRGLFGKPQQKMPPLLYLGLLMIGFPLLIYLPSHLLLRLLFG